MFTVYVHIRYASRKYKHIDYIYIQTPPLQCHILTFEGVWRKCQMCSFCSVASVVSQSVAVTDRDLLKHEYTTVTLLKSCFFLTEKQLSKVYRITTANYQCQKHPPSADGVMTHLSRNAFISSSTVPISAKTTNLEKKVALLHCAKFYNWNFGLETKWILFVLFDLKHDISKEMIIKM